MNVVWLVPVLVVLLGGAALAALLRVTAEAARAFGAEVARFGELHVALGQLRTDVQESARTLSDLRER